MHKHVPAIQQALKEHEMQHPSKAFPLSHMSHHVHSVTVIGHSEPVPNGPWTHEAKARERDRMDHQVNSGGQSSSFGGAADPSMLANNDDDDDNGLVDTSHHIIHTIHEPNNATYHRAQQQPDIAARERRHHYYARKGGASAPDEYDLPRNHRSFVVTTAHVHAPGANGQHHVSHTMLTLHCGDGHELGHTPMAQNSIHGITMIHSHAHGKALYLEHAHSVHMPPLATQEFSADRDRGIDPRATLHHLNAATKYALDEAARTHLPKHAHAMAGAPMGRQQMPRQRQQMSDLQEHQKQLVHKHLKQWMAQAVKAYPENVADSDVYTMLAELPSLPRFADANAAGLTSSENLKTPDDISWAWFMRAASEAGREAVLTQARSGSRPESIAAEGLFARPTGERIDEWAQSIGLRDTVSASEVTAMVRNILPPSNFSFQEAIGLEWIGRLMIQVHDRRFGR